MISELDSNIINKFKTKEWEKKEHAEFGTPQFLRNDMINIIPKYNHLIDYQNDHNINTKTNCLGYNGKWSLTIDRPFYQWLHQARSQGWLIG
mgnify:CR=1 FL=1